MLRMCCCRPGWVIQWSDWMPWASNQVRLMPDEHMFVSNSRRWTMSKKLEGKIALITGGSRGIGAAIAKRLAADGANVAITYAKDVKAASAVVKAIERAGQKAIAIQADAIDADAVTEAVEKTVTAAARWPTATSTPSTW